MLYSIEQRDEQLLETSAGIRYHLYFERAPQHLLRIIMEIDHHQTDLVLALPAWTPGSYKIRDFSAHQGNVLITNQTGKELSWRWLTKNTLHIDAPSDQIVRIEYLYYAFERTVRTSHINRHHAFINFSNCLMFVEGREQETHHVCLHHDRSLWKNTSTSLSQVRDNSQEDSLLLGALNYDILADSPVEIGNHEVLNFTVENALHEIAIAGRGNFDSAWIAQQIQTIVSTEATLFTGLPYDRYVFIIQLYPNSRGGLEHARSSVNMWDANLAADQEKAIQFLSLLCHEFFHTWNVKRIRPQELGPFDYHRENYTSMLWLAEGATSYYDDLLTYRCGFYTQESYLRTLAKEHLEKLHDVPGRHIMSVKDSSMLAWIKLYIPTADSSNRFPSYYLKGGVIFLLLDLFIIAQSDGSKRLDDGIRALWQHYQERPQTGVTEEEFIEIVESATGVSIRKELLDWIGSTNELPYQDIFAPLGLILERKMQRKQEEFGEKIPFMSASEKMYTGLKLKDENGKTIVTVVDDGSPASRAGIGVDDEILAVNEIRTQTTQTFDNETASCGAHGTMSILASCDGMLYTTHLQPMEKQDWVLTLQEDATNEQKRLLNLWLAR